MKERVQRWDNIKGILIVLVVFGHFFESFIEESQVYKWLWNIIYTFHMPLFIFMSGLFAKSSIANKAKLNRKIFLYIRLYLYYKIIIMFERLILTRECGIRFFEESSVPWYMLAMAVFMWITYYVKDLKPGYVFGMAVVLSCIVGYDGKINDFLALARVVNFYPFFLMGYYCNTDMKVFKQSIKKKILSWGILTIFCMLVGFFSNFSYKARPILTGRNTYYGYEYPELGWLYKLIYIVVAVIVGLCIINIIDNNNSILTFMGLRTLPIYFMHGVIIRIFRYLGGEKYILRKLPNRWEMVVVLLSIVVLAISSHNVFKNIFDKIASGKYIYKESK